MTPFQEYKVFLENEVKLDFLDKKTFNRMIYYIDTFFLKTEKEFINSIKEELPPTEDDTELGNIYNKIQIATDALNEIKKKISVVNLSSFDKMKNEKDRIIAAYEINNGNRKNIATALNMSERTLYRKLKTYGIDNQLIFY